MARNIGSKNKSTGSRFKAYEGRFANDKHVRLTKSMMLDPIYLGLSSNAKTLYNYMKMWACGHDTVEYAASLSSGFMSSSTFFKARDELVEKGFIEYPNKYRARDMRETAEYEFSKRWSIPKVMPN